MDVRWIDSIVSDVSHIFHLAHLQSVTVLLSGCRHQGQHTDTSDRQSLRGRHGTNQTGVPAPVWHHARRHDRSLLAPLCLVLVLWS